MTTAQMNVCYVTSFRTARGILVDTGFQGINELVRSITPIEKPARVLLFEQGVAFKNYNVKLQKLHSGGKDWFNRHRNRQLSIGYETNTKNNAAQTK